MAQQKTPRSLPRDRLFQKMSEVISPREKVAQAELAAGVLKPGIDMRDEVAGPEKESNPAGIGEKVEAKAEHLITIAPHKIA